MPPRMSAAKFRPIIDNATSEDLIPTQSCVPLTAPRGGCTLRGGVKCVMLAVFCALLLGCGQRGAGWPGDSALPAAVSRSSSGNYIQHVVIMIQENRSYDNLFATFPGGDGARDGKTHDGKTIRLKQGGLEFDSLGHQHFAFEKEYDHGRMDGFDLVMRAVERGAKIPAGKYAYRYVNPELIEPYWAWPASTCSPITRSRRRAAAASRRIRISSRAVPPSATARTS